MFVEELKGLKEELKITTKQLSFLEGQVNTTFDTKKLKRHLAALKSIRVGKLPTAHIEQKLVKARKVVTTREVRTRRKKSEMAAFRAQIKSMCQLLGNRHESFTSSDVLNALVAQGFDGNESDRQITRSTMLSYVKEGWLEKIGRSGWKLVKK